LGTPITLWAYGDRGQCDLDNELYHDNM